MKTFGQFVTESNTAGGLVELINMNLFKLTNSPGGNERKILLLTAALSMLNSKDPRAVINARKLYQQAMG